MTSSPGQDRREALASCKSLSHLTPELLDLIAERTEPRSFRPGELLLSQGDPGDCLLVLVEGTARAQLHDGDGGLHEIGRVSAGDVLGEMALLTDEPRTVDVVAETAVRVLSLPAQDFHQLAARHLELGMTLTRLIADRLGQHDLDGLGGKICHGYRIRRCVGRGGMSIVYEADDPAASRRVALKMLSHRLTYEPGALRRFRREAETVQRLEHENIARLYSTFSAYNTHFLVMEFCDGGTLAELSKRRGPLPEPQARKVLGQIASALQYVHDRNLVHRDLKPSNVMLDGNAVVKLTDFGLALPDQSVADLDDTFSELIIGTPRFMAPEQLSGGHPDARADIYALACLAWQLLTGQPLFRAKNLMALVQEKLRVDLPPASRIGSGISTEMYELLRTGLQSDPDRRPASVRSVAAWAAPLDRREILG